MNESIMEFKIKGYSVKAFKDSLSIFKNDELLMKLNYQQMKGIAKWLILKVNQLKDSSEIKSLEK